MAVAITSILMNSSLLDNYNFYVIENNLTDNNKSKINRMKEIFGFNLTYINISDSEFENCVLSENKSLYYKFKIALRLNNVSNILWLVPYVIVKEDISILCNSNISDYYAVSVLAAQDNMHNCGLNTAADNCSINSEMMLINTKKLREIDIKNRIFKHFKNSEYRKQQDKKDLFSTCIYRGIDKIYTIDNSSINHSNYPDLICKNKLKKAYYSYISYTPWRYFIIIAAFYKVMLNFADILKRFFNFYNCKQYNIFTQFGHKF